MLDSHTITICKIEELDPKLIVDLEQRTELGVEKDHRTRTWPVEPEKKTEPGHPPGGGMKKNTDPGFDRWRTNKL